MSPLKILLAIIAAGTTGIAGTCITKEFIMNNDENKNEDTTNQKESEEKNPTVPNSDSASAKENTGAGG